MKFLDLLEKIVTEVVFYVDKNAPEVFYAQYINQRGVTEFSRIDSFAFRGYLTLESAKVTQNAQIIDVERSIKYLQYELSAYKECEEIVSFVRIAGNLDSYIEYDLQNPDGESVIVTRDNWKISNKNSMFITPKNSLPQVTPKKTSKSPVELLKPFINLKGNDFIIFVVWLIQAFSCGTHHALLVMAEKGSGKTTLSRIIKTIIDPFRFSISAIPEKKSDLIVLLYNTWLCCLDNVSQISGDVSDILCGAITGTSSVGRSLFTNTEISIATLHNTIVINGIEIVPGKDDLAERMLIVTPRKLKSNIEQEKKLWEKFEKQLPYILGSIFNTLSTAMTVMDTLKLNWLPRMADSYAEMMAIAKALGINEDDFCVMYKQNIQKMTTLRSRSPLVEAIDEYMQSIEKRKVAKKSETIFQEILNKYSGDKTLLPSASCHFSRRIDEEHHKLLEAGYRVNIDDTSASGTEISIIKKKK